ncbi:MAG: DUF4388 domain-containing protein [Calditrichaeota bacterium]|nr:MAG: DUF4388 domain-containing protein [Calditrichota bacterium]
MKYQSLDQLRNIPLFSDVGDEDLELIADALIFETYPAGTRIIREGAPGDAFYIIRDGSVMVSAYMENEDDEIVLTHLKAGDHFGEMALISGEPRSASVTAISDLQVWKLEKATFDELILHNPSITLTLTHLLTQRLKTANLARKETEAFYHKRFMPGGSLRDVSPLQLLQYAENNSLTGHIHLTRGDEKAEFLFKKGILEHVTYNDLAEDDALDVLLDWDEGHYRIEPESLDPTDGNGTGTAEAKPEETETPNTRPPYDMVRDFLETVFKGFVHFAGPRHTQRALNHAYHTYGDYFKNLQKIRIQTHPRLSVRIAEEKWTDKDTLMAAVMLRDVTSLVERELVGFEFWSPQSGNPELDAFMQSIQFFDYYEQATDFLQ